VLGLLCVLLFPGGAFDEFDFWTGTFSLIIFAFAEVIIFGWIFGIERGWAEIKRGADLKLPGFFKYVIKYVTPTFIGVVLLGALIKPVGAWGDAVHACSAPAAGPSTRAA
jgi:NSS family neurotransmitter:Na+ symporter